MSLGSPRRSPPKIWNKCFLTVSHIPSPWSEYKTQSYRGVWVHVANTDGFNGLWIESHTHTHTHTHPHTQTHTHTHSHRQWQPPLQRLQPSMVPLRETPLHQLPGPQTRAAKAGVGGREERPSSSGVHPQQPGRLPSEL